MGAAYRDGWRAERAGDQCGENNGKQRRNDEDRTTDSTQNYLESKEHSRKLREIGCRDASAHAGHDEGANEVLAPVKSLRELRAKMAADQRGRSVGPNWRPESDADEGGHHEGDAIAQVEFSALLRDGVDHVGHGGEPGRTAQCVHADGNEHATHGRNQCCCQPSDWRGQRAKGFECQAVDQRKAAQEQPHAQ